MLRAIPIFLVAMAALASESQPNDANMPVIFADANLKDMIARELNTEEPTINDMHSLVSLTVHSYGFNDFNDLSGLEHAINLKKLSLCCRPYRNGSIQDLSPLTRCTQLEEVELPFHQISDIQVLGTLLKLTKLDLRKNQITDISPLQNLTTLTWLNLRNNPIETSVYDTQLSVICKNNPHLRDLYDRFRLKTLLLPGILTVLVIVIGIGIMKATYRSVYTRAMVVMAILSGITGGFLGIGSQLLYVVYSNIFPELPGPRIIIPGYMGMAWGLVFGVLVGASYVTVSEFMLARKQKNRLAISYGALAGVLCSTLVHIMLAISYHEHVGYAVIGAAFGLVAGTIFGSGYYVYIGNRAKKQTPNEIGETDAYPSP